MILPSFVVGLLLGAFVPAFRDPAIRFLLKQIEILQRRLAERGVTIIAYTPEERLALLAISKEIDNHVKLSSRSIAGQLIATGFLNKKLASNPNAPVGHPSPRLRKLLSLSVSPRKTFSSGSARSAAR